MSNILPRVKIDTGRDLSPGWIAIVEDKGGAPYGIDTLLYICQPNRVADAMPIAEAVVEAINSRAIDPHDKPSTGAK